MKLYSILLLIICAIPSIAQDSHHAIKVESGEKKGKLKYEATHGSIEVVVLSADIGSAWHSEDLAVYFRTPKKSEVYIQKYYVPFTSGHRQFKCEVINNELIISARADKNSKFTRVHSLLLPKTNL